MHLGPQDIISAKREGHWAHLQQIALQPQRHGRLWPLDGVACFLHVYVEDGFAGDALVGGFGAEGRDEPDGCHAIFAGGENWKRRVSAHCPGGGARSEGVQGKGWVRGAFGRVKDAWMRRERM